MKQAKLLFLLMLLAPMCSRAKDQGYAVFDPATGTLTFKLGEKPSGEYVYDTDDTQFVPGWRKHRMQLKKVVFTDHFYSAKPKSTANWFRFENDEDGSNFTEIEGLQNLNPLYVTNMNCMFYRCNGLTNLDMIQYWDTKNVTSMNSMFGFCSKLKTLTFKNFDTGKVEDMTGMFYYCTALESITFSYKFNTSKVKSMNTMFAFCSSLKSLDLQYFETGNVESMFGMFSGCSSLQNIKNINFSNSKVTTMQAMFYNCSSLEELNLSKFKTSMVTSMCLMFSGCRSMKELDLSSFSTGNVTNMGAMFYDCSCLEKLILSSFDTGNVTNMEEMFYNCSSLKSPKTYNFTTNKVTTMKGMFYYCNAIETLDLSSFRTDNVTNMESMFYHCHSLKNLDISCFNTKKVTTMFNMFQGCYNLTSIDLSSFDTSNVTDMWGMFYCCKNIHASTNIIGLTSIYVSNKWNMKKVTDSENMFTNSSDIVGGKGTAYNPGKVDGTYARVDKGTSAPGYFTLAENKNGKLYSIGENSATVCSVKDNEEDVEIPAIINFDGTECPVTEIGEKAFESNTLMTELTIPETVTAIGDGAFAGCTSLEAIYCYATTPIALGSGSAMVRTRSGGEETSASSVFDEVDKETCILYVPQGCHDAYAAADGWCEFIHIEEMGDPLATGETFTEDGAIYEVLADGTVKLTKNRTIPENYAIRENVMHNGVKYKVTAIGAYAINKWELNMFTIPSTINDIGPEAIKATSFLETVISHIEEPFEIPEDLFMADVWDSATKTSTYIPNATLYVPVGTRDKYDAAGWTSHFAKVVEGERLEQFAGALKYAYATSDDEATVIQDKSYKDLTEVNIPATVTMGGKVYNVTSIGCKAFEKCSKLTSVALPEGLKKIGVEAFIYYLGDITLPSTLKTIGDFSFSYSGITTMVIPEGVESIETQALCYCRDLIKVVLPKSLKKIGYLQTNHSTNIKAVISYIEEPFTIGENTFTNGDGNSSSPSPATLYVPKGTKQLYETAGWTTQFATVKELVPGDADGDEDVDFDDIEITKNYIMTGEAEDFIFENADMNGDNEINAADIVKILNIIKSMGN